LSPGEPRAASRDWIPDNAEAVVREVFARFNAGGVEAIMDDITPDVKVTPFPEWPDDPFYEGREGFRRLLAQWGENFDDYSWEVQEVREAPGGVVILARHGGRTKGQGIWVEQPVSALFRFRGRQTCEMRYFLTWDEAIEAGAQ
jgi:ketosteroid isomerase-like protein